MELAALPVALSRLFPGQEFYAVPKNPTAGDPFDGFTTSDVRTLRAPPGAPTLASKLVRQMASEIDPGRRGVAADLVVVLDDVELANAPHPDAIVDRFRDEVHAHVARFATHGRHDKTARLLRERASFHLQRVMVESWLFADPRGPANAGVPADRLPAQHDASVDPEAFTTAHEEYLGHDECACAAWHALTGERRKRQRPAWGAKSREERGAHPKAYLSWLCRDLTAQKKCTRYAETGGGAEALKALDWAAVLADGKRCTFLRALVDDLADGLRTAPSVGPLPPNPGPAPTRHDTPRAERTLRNI